jgi:hypothetical protein
LSVPVKIATKHHFLFKDIMILAKKNNVGNISSGAGTSRLEQFEKEL